MRPNAASDMATERKLSYDNHPPAPIHAAPRRRMAILSAAMALGLAAGCGVGWATEGSGGLAAPLAAAATCWAGGLAAIAAEDRLGRRRGLAAGLLAGVGLHLAPPVALALGARLHGGGLWQAGLAYYLGAFYIVVLCTETAARLPLRPATRGPSLPR